MRFIPSVCLSLARRRRFRRRSVVQDDTWIEQLATKREKVGAAKTIAVSSSGFSESARLTAALKGIELRNLREVTPEEIVEWLRSVVINKVALHWLSFELECWHAVTSEVLASSKQYEYSGTDGVIVLGSEFRTSIEDVPVILDVHLKPPQLRRGTK